MIVKRLKFLGYVRTSRGSMSHQDQIEAITAHCNRNSYEILGFFSDELEPAVGYANALAGLSDVDGLIVTDLTRMVPDSSETLREVRPVLTEKILHEGKKFVSIADGLENITASGQEHLRDLLNDCSRGEKPVERSMQTHQAV
jgi:Resolvase, N terminal domain